MLIVHHSGCGQKKKVAESVAEGSGGAAGKHIVEAAAWLK